MYGKFQLFQLCSTANSNISFYVPFFQLNCIKIQTMSLVLHLSEISAMILCDLFTLTSSFASDFKTSYLRRLEDIWFTTSWRRPIYDVLKTFDLRRLEDVWFTTSWRRLIYDVLKTPVKRRLCSNVVATTIQRRKRLFFLIIFRKF